ncbi:MAG: nitroreductase family protein [Saccharofermentanales bacterium]|jgi:nitroreductase
MRIKRFLSYLYYKIVSALMQWKYYTGKAYDLDRQAAELIRNCHSIEKGLCIKEENIRLGFGHTKQLEMLDRMERLRNSKETYHQEAVKMALAVLHSYVRFHQFHNYTDEIITKIDQHISQHYEQISNWANYGGILAYQAQSIQFDDHMIEQLFFTRHSIRDFDDSAVDQELIKKAVELAQRCPSACNRQGVRVYNISNYDDNIMADWLSGIGGFAKQIPNYLLITGKISAYRVGEHSQFIVSASIFAAYLSLALHAVGLGCCVIQRKVEWNKPWESVKRHYSIPDDEQSICVIGVGNLKNITSVPISHRLPVEVIYRTIPDNRQKMRGE